MTSFKKFFFPLVICIYYMFGQGPDPCPCDPTEGEAAYEACLLLHPECNEDIPIDSFTYVLAGTGLLYATYMYAVRKESNRK